MKTKWVAILALCGAAFVPFLASAQSILSDTRGSGTEMSAVSADIYASDACGSCGVYLEEELLPFLEARGVSYAIHDYVNDTASRHALTEKEDVLKIPFKLRSHFMTFLSDGIVFAGHISPAVMDETLDARGRLPATFLVYNDDMSHGGPEMNSIEAYALWPAKEGIYETNSRPVLSGYVSGDVLPLETSRRNLLPLVLTSGLLDSLNPCAFVVLLLFIGFLFVIKRKRRQVFAMGMVYIIGIFLAYVGIGLGILKAITLSDTPHFIGRVAAWLVVAIGTFGLLRIVYPNLPNPFGIPEKLKPVIQKRLYRATFPAALLAGILVGLCTFPCSGGIYVAILGLVAAQATRISGIGYLLLYNLMFILPLIVVLFLSSNKLVVEKIRQQKQEKKRLINIALYVLLIVVSAIMLIFYV